MIKIFDSDEYKDYDVMAEAINQFLAELPLGNKDRKLTWLQSSTQHYTHLTCIIEYKS